MKEKFGLKNKYMSFFINLAINQRKVLYIVVSQTTGTPPFHIFIFNNTLPNESHVGAQKKHNK